MDVELVLLADDPDRAPLRAAAYHSVLRPSFSRDELSGPEAVEPAPGRDVVCALVAGRVAAVGVGDHDERSGLTMLSYLASEPGARGLGLGAKVLDRLRLAWRDHDYDVVLAEVHDPRVWQESADERPRARLRFYERAGCRLLPVPWIQPAVPGGRRVPGMLLLVVHPVDGTVRLSAERLRTWARNCFEADEGAVPDDPQWQWLAAHIGQGDVAPGALCDLAPVPLAGPD